MRFSINLHQASVTISCLLKRFSFSLVYKINKAKLKLEKRPQSLQRDNNFMKIV